MFRDRLLTFVLALVVVAMVAGCAAPAAAPAPAAPAAPAAQPTAAPAAAAQPTAAPAAAAAQPTAAPAAAAGKPITGKFKVGLLSPGSVNDQGWNSIAYGALKRIESELGAEISYVELKQDPASYEKAFRDFASQGYQMILGHGNEFQDAAVTVAKDYPDTQFFISSSRIHEPNVTGLNTASDQTFYLMGVAAAKLCKAAGLVGGMEIPPVSEAFIGFVNGARSVKPDFKYFQTYIGNFDDAAAAKEAALGMIAQGADCIVPDADVAGQGAYQAVVEKGPNIWTFGAFTSATKSAPGQVIANYTSDYGQGIVGMAKEVKDGTFKGGKNVEFGVGQPDVMKFEWDSTSKLPVPQDVKDAVEAAKAELAAGKVNSLAPLK